MQRKTPDRNSHYIGNKEQKYTYRNKTEKTTDSRKTLTSCGFSLFCRKNILCRSRYEKWEKCFQTAAGFFSNRKSQKSGKRLFPFEMELRFFKKCVLFPFEMGKGRKLTFLKNFPLYQKQGCKIAKYFPIAMETGGQNRENSIPIIPETKG